MSVSYYIGQFGFKQIIEKQQMVGFKQFTQPLKKYSPEIYVTLKMGKVERTPELKVLDDRTYNGILADMEKLKATIQGDNRESRITRNGFTFDLKRSGGRFKVAVYDEEGNALSASKPKTDQQEDAVVFLLNCGHMKEKAEINKAVGFEFGKDWHHSFEKTFDAITRKIIPKSKLGQYKFYRDSDKKKPYILNKITDEKNLPTKKDNWNPSDVWAVKTSAEKKLNDEITKLCENLEESNDITLLNKYVKEKFEAGEIIGISLKQITTSQANCIKVENDVALFNAIKYTGINRKFEYRTNNSYFDIEFNIKSPKLVEYRFRFRPRGASNQLNVYGEGQPVIQKTFDGAIDKAVINKNFSGLDTFTKFVENYKTAKTVSKSIDKLPQFDDFKKFMKRRNFALLNVNGLDDSLGEYEIRRSMVLLYYIFRFETTGNQPQLFKDFYLSAKKMNEFSSVHWKVY